jgi:pyrroline-5-carboxylate reductase
MATVAIVGVGRIGGALLEALHADASHELVAVVRRPEHAHELVDRLGVMASADPTAVGGAGVVLYCTKPQDMSAVVRATRDHLDPGALVVSVVTGMTITRLGGLFCAGTPIVRAVTNTAAELRAAVTVLSAAAGVGPERVRLAEEVFGAVGEVRHLPEEMLDAVSAIAGGGGAYVFFLVEVLTHAGVLLGLTAPTARDLTVEAVRGAAALLDADRTRHPVQLREDVMSRGGATIAAFRVLEERAVRSALLDAVEAAHRRCVELGER